MTTQLTELPSDFIIQAGSHQKNEPNGGFDACVMEAVAYVAGEQWSDHPQCASPLITSACISLNDVIKDDDYRTQLLTPLIPRIIDTRDRNDLQRSYLALDWIVRVYLPAWLALTPALESRSRELQDLPPIANAETFGSAVQTLLKETQKDAGAARAAAGDAAWAAAWAAAGAAARDAAWAAAGAAARDAAWAAAGAAARDAAGAAARDAAREKFAPVTRELQASFAGVLGQMCEVGK